MVSLFILLKILRWEWDRQKKEQKNGKITAQSVCERNEDPLACLVFQDWLKRNYCYIFIIYEVCTKQK